MTQQVSKKSDKEKSLALSYKQSDMSLKSEGGEENRKVQMKPLLRRRQRMKLFNNLRAF